MRVIQAYTVDQALIAGLSMLHRDGIRRSSRNGDVHVMDSPVTTEYLRPRNRVLFWPARDANPFFHFFESLWMLAGKNDVAYLTQFVQRFKTFSDDGVTLHGAYGHRWRYHFDMEGGGHPALPDQLRTLIKRLRDNPDDRRCVLTMWDPVADLDSKSKDVPCNTHAYFSRGQQGQLDMTVCCRSNDLIWGCCGANAVHFSVLQEVMAAAIDAPVGRYWQVSNNYHAYDEVFLPLYEKLQQEPANIYGKDPYTSVSPSQIVNTPINTWLTDLESFFYTYKTTFKAPLRDPFFTGVVLPMEAAHVAVKNKHYDRAVALMQQCHAEDWRRACIEWINRRKANHERAADNGPVY